MAWGRAEGELDVHGMIARAQRSRALHVMPSRKLDSRDCLRLCAALAQAPGSLTQLDLSGHALEEEGVGAIGALLATPGCCIERLGLGDARFGAAGIEALTKALGGAQSGLLALDLEYRGLNDAAGGILGEMFSHSLSQLRELNLARNPLGDSGMHSLIRTVDRGLSLLEAVDFSEMNLTQQGLIMMSDAMLPSGMDIMPSLSLITVSRNAIGDEGIAALARLVEARPAIMKVLKVSACNFSAHGAALLGHAIGKSAAQLQLLDLEENPGIGDAGCVALAEGLMDHQSQSSVAQLKLSSCGCADCGAVALSKVAGIKDLSLQHSFVGITGVTALLGLRGLQRLSLFNDSTLGKTMASLQESGSRGNNDRDAFRVALGGSVDLCELDLGACAISDSNLFSAFRDVSYAPGLECLELNGNPLEPTAFSQVHANLKQCRPGLDVVWTPQSSESQPCHQLAQGEQNTVEDQDESDDDDEPPSLD